MVSAHSFTADYLTCPTRTGQSRCQVRRHQTRGRCRGGPRVRIRFPPALNLLRTSFSGGKAWERSAETTREDPETVSSSSGTDGSNPAPSSEESCANPVLPAIAANLFEPEDIG